MSASDAAGSSLPQDPTFLSNPLPPPQPSTNPRRLPPPCWSPDETVALIDAYREKWYTLRRGNLKANHWQEVADAIANRCPIASPPKTAVQCRHKMEKLRKRYRTEIQRARSMPLSRFSSSWVHFKRMDAMEKGPETKPDYKTESDGDDDDDDDENHEENDNNQGFYQESYNFMNTRSIEKLYRNGVGSTGNSVSGAGAGAGGYRIRIPTGVSMAQTAPPKFYGVKPTLGCNSTAKPNFSSGLENTRVSRVEDAGKKREREAIEEMVAAIKALGDGFVRVEQMKMEMARKMETMRMDMEMKRTEMILESQQRIVEAFAEAFSEKKKPKRVTSPKS